MGRKLHVGIEHDGVRIGERLGVSFHRTLRIPDDGSTYPLPPGLGRLPVVSMGRRRKHPSLVIPLRQREAMWIGFSGAAWKPNALKILVGGINAVSGGRDGGERLNLPQDYLVCPDQPWLDGFNAGNGTIRQFVAMPLGAGYAVEAAQGGPEEGGIKLVAFEPRSGRFPDVPPAKPSTPERTMSMAARMGLGAGGRMRQRIYPDPYGYDAWDQDWRGEVELQIVNSERFSELTGEEPPPTPIEFETYIAHGLPWFDLYDEERGTLARPEGSRLKTIAERDAERGVPGADAVTVVPPEAVRTIVRPEPRGRRTAQHVAKTREKRKPD